MRYFGASSSAKGFLIGLYWTTGDLFDASWRGYWRHHFLKYEVGFAVFQLGVAEMSGLQPLATAEGMAALVRLRLVVEQLAEAGHRVDPCQSTK